MSLYKLKSSANAWHTHFFNTFQNKIGLKVSLIDDAWLKKGMQPGGSLVYTCMLVYIDEMLIVSYNPTKYMDQLKLSYYIKKDSIGPPDLMLVLVLNMSETELATVTTLQALMTMSKKQSKWLNNA